MNIKTKLILGIGMLAGMIILLVTLSVVNLHYGFPLPAASVS